MDAIGSFVSPPSSYRSLTICSGLRASAARTPDKVAVILDQDRRTYAQFLAAVNRIANVVAHHFAQGAGDVVTLLSPNGIEYLEIVAGVSETGAAVATPSPRLSAAEIADICNQSGTRLLFVHPVCADRIDRSRLGSIEHIVWIGAEYEQLKACASDRYATPAIPEWQTFAIPYTSGTTGRPKGVMLPHRSRTLGFLAYAAEYGCYSPDDRFLAITPMCHGAGFAFAFAPLFLGGCTQIMTRFDPERLLREVHAGDVTGFFSVPTHYHDMFALEPKLLTSLRGNRLRAIVANAAPLSTDAKEHILDYFGPGLLHETYGSTEAGVVSNLRPADQQRKTRCVGLPFLGNRVRLIGADGAEVRAGEVGELFSNSPYLFNGYLGLPEQSRESFVDGWLSVGDLATRDDEGYLYVVDRKKDMVISGGINLYPREIEAVIDLHAAVLESAVIGVPDARWGERLVAFVVPAAGQQIDADALANFCRQSLADYKVPKDFLPLEALPRNANGKVLKAMLRERAGIRDRESRGS